MPMELLGVIVAFMFGLPILGAEYLADNPLIILIIVLFAVSIACFARARRLKYQEKVNSLVKSGHIWM